MRKQLLILAVALMSAAVRADECAWCSDLSLGSVGQIKPTKMKFSWSQGEAETNKVDLLFAFDSAARDWLTANGWTEEDYLNEVVFEMNAGLALTGLDECFTFRLVGRYDIDANLSDLKISRLYNYSSGRVKKEGYETHFAPLRQLREDVAADIVVVIYEPQDTSYYGVSLGLTSEYLTKTGIVEYAEHAYCVVDVRAAFDRFCVLHEVGHIFGAGHADTQRTAPGPQLFSYSSGYKFSADGTDYVTVMGYLTLNSEGKPTNTYLPAFSSPDYLLDGVPIGTASKNDNTRTLRETHSVISNFRVARYIPGYSPSSGGEGGDAEARVIDLSVCNEQGRTISDGEVLQLRQFVNVAFDVSAHAKSGAKTTVKVTGLPSGLKYSVKSGLITGCPKKAGSFSVKVKATAKRCDAATKKFTFNVLEPPASLIGSYAGIISNATSGAVLATATVAKTGKVSVKFMYMNASRTFSCRGFDSVETGSGGEAAFSATTESKIKSVSHTKNIRICSRTMTIDGYSGILLQNPWGRGDLKPPQFKKAVKVQHGELSLKLYGKGKAKVSGKISGVGVSGVFQIVAGRPEIGYRSNEWTLPVYFEPKRRFAGWTGWLPVKLETNAANQVVEVRIDLVE